MTEQKDSTEYRLLILEQNVKVLQMQQEDFRQLSKELNNILVKTQMYEITLTDVKERLDDHKTEMKALREETKKERLEFLSAQRDFQKDSTDKMDKIQNALLDKLDKLAATTDEKIKTIPKDTKPTNTIINLSDGTLQIIMKVILSIVTILCAIYGIKIM